MASAEYSVLTPERVSLQYDIAGVGSRCAAAVVDTFIQTVALLVFFIAVSAGTFALARERTGGVFLGIALLSLVVFLITGGYYILFEILWNGQTPGKRLVGLRVIRENGYPLRPVDAVIRNIVRLVDWLPFAYAVGVATMLLNGRAKRLGDFAAGTIVIREGQRGLTSVLLPPSETLLVGRGVSLSNADATLVRDFLVRRGTMAGDARRDLAQRLSSALARRYGLTVGDDPDRFLEELAG